MVRGVVQIFKKQEVYWLLFGKPHDVWPSKLVWFLMTTYITYVTNFVQIREGHVKTLVECIWIDPYTVCTCYQLILIAVLNMVYSTIFIHDKQKHHTDKLTSLLQLYGSFKQVFYFNILQN